MSRIRTSASTSSEEAGGCRRAPWTAASAARPAGSLRRAGRGCRGAGRPFPLLAALAALAGCGYVGDPQPPLLNIPERITDLEAVQRGDALIVIFSPPARTTEGVALRHPARLELRAGAAPDPFDTERWAAAAKVYVDLPLEQNRAPENSRVKMRLSALEWTGQEIVLGARATSKSERQSGWSNFAAIRVAPPVAPPEGLAAEASAGGVRLSWRGAAEQYRVFRNHESGDSAGPAATVSGTQWIDTDAQYGESYRYQVQAVSGKAESELSSEVVITPRDVFPPSAPAGLMAAASVQSIELAWERNLEPDLAGYRVYRARGDAALERIAETQISPAFSDRGLAAGQRYRYAVSALDRAGNESPVSEMIAVTAP